MELCSRPFLSSSASEAQERRTDFHKDGSVRGKPFPLRKGELRLHSNGGQVWNLPSCKVQR
jgi:hypothetical protein